MAGNGRAWQGMVGHCGSCSRVHVTNHSLLIFFIILVFTVVS